MKRHLNSMLGLLVLVLAAVGSASPAAAATPSADLAVTHLSYFSSLRVGQVVKFHITAKNHGPATSELDVVATTSDNLETISNTCVNGPSPDGNWCEYSNVPPYTTVYTVLEVRVLRTSSTRYWVTATAEGAQYDPKPSNDSLTVGGSVHR